MAYQPSTNGADLYERAKRLLDALALPDGVGLARIVDRVAALTGKDVVVEPLGDRDWETVTGLLLVRPTSATVLVRKSDPRWYQIHAALHELSHLMWEHPGCGTLPVRGLSRRHVLPGQQVLARGVVTKDFEREVDFSDTGAVIEAEAEKLTQMISGIVFAAKHSRDEAVFG